MANLNDLQAQVDRLEAEVRELRTSESHEVP